MLAITYPKQMLAITYSDKLAITYPTQKLSLSVLNVDRLCLQTTITKISNTFSFCVLYKSPECWTISYKKQQNWKKSLKYVKQEKYTKK